LRQQLLTIPVGSRGNTASRREVFVSVVCRAAQRRDEPLESPDIEGLYHVGVQLSGTSIATTQLPQQPALVFVGAVVGPWRKTSGHFHAGSEILAPRIARRSFVIASHRVARRTTTQRHCGHHALEHDGAE